MLEGILTFFLISLLPDIAMAPVIIGGYAAYEDIKSDIQLEDAIEADCDIYVKDYTDCNPEWKWSTSKNSVNYHEVLGFPLETIERDLIKTGLRKLEKGKHGSNTNYTLKLYFREGLCVKVEYWRPMDKNFLASYGHGESKAFHVHSKFFKEDVPIDFTITYYDFLNFINGKDPQMLITAMLCGDAMPYVSTGYCHCK